MKESGTEMDDRPLYSRRRTIIMRTIVWIAAGAMLLPIFLSVYTSNAHSAAIACMAATQHAAPDATGADVKFEVFGQGGIGWECYATGGFGGTRHIASLGIFPGPVTYAPDGIDS